MDNTLFNSQNGDIKSILTASYELFQSFNKRSVFTLKKDLQLSRQLNMEQAIKELTEDFTKIEAALELCVSAVNSADKLTIAELEQLFDLIEKMAAISSNNNSCDRWKTASHLVDVVLVSFVRCSSRERGSEIYFKAGNKLMQVSMTHLENLDLDHHLFPQVVENLFVISQKTCNLEPKTMATFWKFFLKFLQRVDTQQTTKIDATPTLTFLSSEIQQLFRFLIDGVGSPVKMIKVAGFYLRTIVNLIDIFSDSLQQAELTKSLVELGLALFNFTGDGQSSRIFDKEPNCLELRKLSESQLGLAVTPLVKKITLSPFGLQIMRENLVSYSEKDPLSLCRLTGKLLLPEMQQQGPCNSLVETLELFLDSVDLCHAAFSGKVSLHGVMHSGKPQHQVPAYELLCTEACAGLAVASANDIQDCVIVLLERVVKAEIWAFLMSADILCFVARFGTASFCQDLVLLILKLLKPDTMDLLLPNSGTQHRILLLLNRLMNLLTNGARENLLEKYRPEKFVNLWASISWTTFPSKQRVFVERYLQLVEKHLSDKPVEALRLLHSLYVFNHSSISEPAKKFSPALLKIPIHFAGNVNYSLDIVLSLLSCCLSNMVDFSNQDVLLQILRIFTSLGSCNSTVLFAAELLKEFSDIKLPPSTLQQPILRAVSNLFNQILACGHLVARYLALRAFTDFARKTVHTSIVPHCVKEEQQQLVSSFLEKNQMNLAALPMLLKDQEKVLLSKTSNSVDVEEEEVLESAVKKPRLDPEVDTELETAINSIRNAVAVMEKRQTLPQWANGELINIRERLTMLEK